MKKLEIELMPDPEMGGFTARIPGIPAYGEGETEETAIADLKNAVAAYSSAFGMKETLTRAVRPALRTLPVSLEEFARA